MYKRQAWNRLAKCYRDTLPGVALYAWLQAEQRQPDAWQHRAVAYQEYQVEDFYENIKGGKPYPLELSYSGNAYLVAWTLTGNEDRCV